MIYKFQRGEEFIVYVQVTNNETLTYCNIQYPENTTTDVVEQFLLDAETAVLKQLESGEEYYDKDSDAI